jgi:hypothetical protein
MTDISTEAAKAAADNIDSKFFALVYKDAAQPGVKQVGKALATVLGLGNTALLPIKLLNSKAQVWYARHMEEYREQLKNIPEEKIIEVAPEIGVPILENLEKTTSNEVSSLYINLLTNASTIDFVSDTHPRFVSIIENLTSDEAKILELFGPEGDGTCTFINIKESTDVKNVPFYKEAKYEYTESVVTKTVNRRATMFEKMDYLSLPDKSKFYLENIALLGLIEADDDSFIVSSNYNIIIEAFDKEINSATPNTTRHFDKGHYKITEFGKLFLKACRKQH